MTLTIHTEEDAQRQLKVRVEVPETRVEEQMRRTAREIGRGVDIPGFRRGKVPYNVLVQRIGPAALRAEAVEELLNPIFEETMAEIEADPYAQPALENMEMEPLVIEFVVPLEPTMSLSDEYRSYRQEIEPVEVTDEAVQEALEHLRTHHEVREPVDRPVMEGDVVTVSGTGEVVEEGAVDVIFDEDRIELLVDPEVTFPGTDFVNNLIGLEVGDSAEFTLTFPDEEPYLPEGEEEEEEGAALAGKEAQFEITVLDIQSRYLPELNDELAQQEGEFETLEELREAVRENLQEQADSEAREDLFDSMIDAMLETAETVYPPAAVDQELDGILENMKEQVTRAGWQWDDYLTLQGDTEEAMREEYRDAAEDRLRRGLALREFVRQERIRIDEDELDAAVDERLKDRFADNPEMQQQMRDFFRQGPGLEAISGQMPMDRVHERMVAIATGTAPSLEELEAAEQVAQAEELAEEEE